MNKDITQETIDLAKEAFGQGQALAKDNTTQGYNQNTGLIGYSLEAPSKKLFPVLTPFRNTLPRVKPKVASNIAHWKAIMGINTTNQRASTGFGYAGNLISTRTKDFAAAYQTISLGDSVQLDAEKMSQGFENIRATASVNLLYALMMQEEIMLLGGQNFTLGTPTAPTITVSNVGGSIGAVNVAIAVAARTMQGYFDGQSSMPSTAATTGALTGATNSLSATVPYVPGAVCYDWYVGIAGGTLYYYGTTAVNKITGITTVPTQAATSTGISMCNVPIVAANGAIATTSAMLAADNSVDANSFNGLIASLIGDYNSAGQFVQHGTGSSCGAYVKSCDGNSLSATQGTIDQIDAGLQYLWATSKVSPDKIMCNAMDHVNISNKIIASGGVYTMYRPDQLSERQNSIGGQLVSTFINKAVNGRPIELVTHPWLPQGTILGTCDTLPYPNNEVENIMEVETLEEYTQYDYAINRTVGQAGGGPRYDFENRAIETFKNYFPASMMILQNVPTT